MPILDIRRYPKASDPSLKSWSAADELLIQHCLEHGESNDRLEKCIVLHDLFGYLSCQLNEYKPQTAITFASQEYAITVNMEKNSCSRIQLRGVTDKWEVAHTAVMKIPKSLELFQLYLNRLSNVLESEGVVFCGFMTRNFTDGWIKLAQEYFSEVSQSRAQKKARVLVLKGPKPKDEFLIKEHMDDEGHLWKQYLGVFSSGRIDPASRFLMEHLSVPKGDVKVVDVGSGNGVLGKFVLSANPDADLHLVDDSHLAVLSGALNVTGKNVSHHCSRDLSFLENNSCDLVVSNPPFHFEYEINMDVAFKIFSEAGRVLRETGELWVVANNNLPYKPELLKHFTQCDVIAQNRKFIIYKCS